MLPQPFWNRKLIFLVLQFIFEKICFWQQLVGEKFDLILLRAVIIRNVHKASKSILNCFKHIIESVDKHPKSRCRFYSVRTFVSSFLAKIPLECSDTSLDPLLKMSHPDTSIVKRIYLWFVSQTFLLNNLSQIPYCEKNLLREPERIERFFSWKKETGILRTSNKLLVQVSRSFAMYSKTVHVKCRRMSLKI